MRVGTGVKIYGESIQMFLCGGSWRCDFGTGGLQRATGWGEHVTQKMSQVVEDLSDALWDAMLCAEIALPA